LFDPACCGGPVAARRMARCAPAVLAPRRAPSRCDEEYGFPGDSERPVALRWAAEGLRIRMGAAGCGGRWFVSLRAEPRAMTRALPTGARAAERTWRPPGPRFGRRVLPEAWPARGPSRGERVCAPLRSRVQPPEMPVLPQYFASLEHQSDHRPTALACEGRAHSNRHRGGGADPGGRVVSSRSGPVAGECGLRACSRGEGGRRGSRERSQPRGPRSCMDGKSGRGRPLQPSPGTASVSGRRCKPWRPQVSCTAFRR